MNSAKTAFQLQPWDLELAPGGKRKCSEAPGVGAAAKQESGILVLWQGKNLKSWSWAAWCLVATWSWRTVTWSASLRHELCQTSTDGVQLADLRFHDFWQKTQWLAEIAGQRFLWKGGLRFFSIRILRAVCAKHMYQNPRSWGSEEPMSKQSGVFVFFICEWPLLVLHRFVADCELLAFVILMCWVQMMLATMLN